MGRLLQFVSLVSCGVDAACAHAFLRSSSQIYLLYLCAGLQEQLWKLRHGKKGPGNVITVS